MKRTDVLRIAHLSDIHFGSFFDHDGWAAVRQRVQAERPDVIVVSGDFVQSPFPLMLVLARRELDALCQDCGAPFFVVPGNHDVAVLGNVRVWPFSRLFRSFFSTKIDGQQWLEKFPAYSAFYARNFFVRFFWRLWLYAKLPLAWLTLPWTAPGPGAEYIASSSGAAVALFGLDSNRSRFLAAGKIRDAQITRLGAAIVAHGPDAHGPLLHRIAVVHHHPIPIPYTPEAVTSFEPFLVLRDAGTFLRELWLHDIDLVLHGHRHRSCFSRLAYGATSDTSKILAVLSAASPTTKESVAGRNSFNLVDVHSNGRVGVTQIEFGGGITLKGMSDATATHFDAVGFDDLKQRNFRRMFGFLGFQCAEFFRHIDIGDLGETTSTIHVRDLEVDDAVTMETQHHALQVDLGGIDPSAIKMIDATPGAQIRQLAPPHDLTKRVEIQVGFPSLVRGSRVSYGLQYVTTNNFRLSEWECKSVSPVADRPSAEEFIGVRVRLPMRRLRIGVRLPTNLASPNPYLTCLRPAGYPHLDYDRATREVQRPTDDEWELDADMTEHERPSLVEVGPRQWEASIRHPLAGYQYRIAWRVQDVREQGVDAYRVGQTEELRKSSVAYRRARLGESGQSLSPAVRLLLRNLLQALLREFAEPKRFRSTDPARETLRVCFFSYDAAADRDRIVAIEEVVQGSGGHAGAADWKLEYGEGVAGLTFKTASPQIYYAPALRIGRSSFSGFAPLMAPLQIEGVLGVPLYHPDAWSTVMRAYSGSEGEMAPADLPSCHEVIGVMTFASSSSGTGLGKIYDAHQSARARFKSCFEFVDVVQGFSRTIIECLTMSQRSSA